MTSLLEKFVTVTQERNDLLSPIEYRTVMEMIRGIVSSFEFKKFEKAKKALFEHMVDFDDPHLVRNQSFYNEIVARVHAIYVNMTATPLSLSDFRTQIAPTIGFAELFRRIILNRYLYDKIKTESGAVPTSVTVHLPRDWAALNLKPDPVTLTFPSGITNEEEYIRAGWNGNSTPFPVIFTADFLSTQRINLPILFATSADSPNTPEDSTGQRTPIIINAGSNDAIIMVRYVGTPTQEHEILSLQNGSEILKVTIDTDEIFKVSINGEVMLTADHPSTDGRAMIVFSSRGYLSLETTYVTAMVKKDAVFVLRDDAPFAILQIKAPYRNLFTTSFGLESVNIYQGYGSNEVDIDINIASGYGLLIDPNGAFLCDSDGTPLFDIILLIDDADIDDFVFLTDRDGTFVTDSNGIYYVTLPFVLPFGEILIVDNDGRFVKDADGFFITEETDPIGDYIYVTDDQGNLVVDARDRYVVLTGYVLLINEDDGAILTDDQRRYLVVGGYLTVVDAQGAQITDSAGRAVVISQY